MWDALESIILPDNILPHAFRVKNRRRKLNAFIQASDEIQIGSGHFGLGAFMSFDDVLKQDLLGILDDFVAYVNRPRVSRPINTFISASPGSGKSFLVRSLIDALLQKLGCDENRFPFMELNLANITHYRVLIQFLTTVSTNAEDGQIPFVLFDEVDAEMPGFNLFQRMLMPMWDGAYLDNASRKTLPPAAFFFAGTPEGLRKIAISHRTAESSSWRAFYGLTRLLDGNFIPRLLSLLSKSLAARRQRVIILEKSRTKWQRKCDKKFESLANNTDLVKFHDFYDRIHQFIFLPPSNVYFQSYGDASDLYFADREMIYFFLLKIKKMFPSVQRVSKAALALLSSNFYRSKRAMEKAIFLSRVGPNEEAYKLESLPRLVAPSSDNERDVWKTNFPGEIRLLA